jgi:Cytochrome oxidase complex assembly protein 1
VSCKRSSFLALVAILVAAVAWLVIARSHMENGEPYERARRFIESSREVEASFGEPRFLRLALWPMSHTDAQAIGRVSAGRGRFTFYVSGARARGNVTVDMVTDVAGEWHVSGFAVSRE